MNYFCTMTCFSASRLCSCLRNAFMYMAQIRHLPNTSPLQSDTPFSSSSNQTWTVTSAALSQYALWVCAGNLDKVTSKLSSLLKRAWWRFIAASTFQILPIPDRNLPSNVTTHLSAVHCFASKHSDIIIRYDKLLQLGSLHVVKGGVVLFWPMTKYMYS